MTVYWLVLDMDLGVLGAFTTKRDALKEFRDHNLGRVHRYGPGSYEVHWWLPGEQEDGTEFFLAREDAAVRGGWDLTLWIAAGRPLGRFDEPYGRSD